MAVAEEKMASVPWQCTSIETELCHVINQHEKCIPTADSENPAEHRNDDDIVIVKSSVDTDEKSASSSPFIQSLSLGESIGTSSEYNDVQEDNNNSIGNPIPHDHNQVAPKPDRPLSCTSHRQQTVKRNKSDKSDKRSKKASKSNSKDDRMGHINHKKWPTRIKTIDDEKASVFGIGISKSGIWAVTDYRNHHILVYNADDEPTRIFGFKGKGNYQFDHPVGVTFDNKGYPYISDYGNHRVQKFDAKFKYVLQFGDEGYGDGQLNHPMGIAAYKDKVYVADSANSRIAVFYTNGKFCCNIIGGCLRDPQDVAISEANDQLLVIDSTCCVHIFALDEGYTYIRKFSSFGTDKGQLNHPFGLAVDSSGLVFVADTYNHRVCIFDICNNTGRFVRSFGSCGSNEEQFNRPQGIAFSPNGNLYISDYENQRVMIFSTKFKPEQKHH